MFLVVVGIGIVLAVRSEDSLRRWDIVVYKLLPIDAESTRFVRPMRSFATATIMIRGKKVNKQYQVTAKPNTSYHQWAERTRQIKSDSLEHLHMLGGI